MNQSLYITASRPAAAAPASASGPGYRNYLIISPQPADETAAADVSRQQVETLARGLNASGFAYVARFNQDDMEDDSFGVRYMPLRDTLPSFGLMTAVIVIDDSAWVDRAAAAYPEAEVFLLKMRSIQKPQMRPHTISRTTSLAA